MKPLSITEIAAACGGELMASSQGCQGGDAMACAVSTDSRSLSQGDLYIALVGHQFDGHAFIDAALEKGAVAVMVDRTFDGIENLSVPAIVVKNTLYGLQRLARWYRRQLDVQVVGITGSNGKTSVKDFTSSVLTQNFQVNATKGNLNNHIGLPLSVLATEEGDDVCIFEMGMNHPGEIAPLCEIAAPGIGIITNIGTAHIEFMGSRDGIAEEKSSLARALPDDGRLIVAASCDYVDYLIERTHAPVIVVGNCRGTVRAEGLIVTEYGSKFELHIDGEDVHEVELKVSGKHMVNNALLAAAAGHSLGMHSRAIADGLNQAELTSGRLRRYQCEGVTVIDDTYNANPDSVIAAINTLDEFPLSEKAKRIIVLGVMAELGQHADDEHYRVGRLAAEKGMTVVSVGHGVEKIDQGARKFTGEVQHFADVGIAAVWLTKNTGPGDCVLFKGSRMAGMERVMNKAYPATPLNKN